MSEGKNTELIAEGRLNLSTRRIIPIQDREFLIREAANYEQVLDALEVALARIEQAPHTISCRSAHGLLADRCDCWKANPYRANPEPKEGDRG